ncbi:hypothetical protein BUALT_Bualt12G0082700 [Buddleja alternifolia]|uniref:Calcineurin-like phosphoesterase domain-containing protein n=1 Tax=Buddleja alternifolia TaxID=168488 RepID=A0AAV6WR80_9LAMI|nr:hypothetical protein BUALT_Bualt12G0082700 [Buddleja alternifolia]
MKEKSWICTLIVQLSLCIAVYTALNTGHNLLIHEGRPPIDMHFLTVAGGFRPLQKQTLLLQQMATVAKTFKARFVVDISEVGGSDPLLRNATSHLALKSMPWYTTGASEGQEKTYFLKKIKIAYGQTLDIIALDTVLFQDPSSSCGKDQIQWLTRTLKESDSDWRVVIGFHQLISCDYNFWKVKEEAPFEPLHKILLEHGVDAYMSMKICDGHIHGQAKESNDAGLMDKGPYLTSMDQNLVIKDEAVDGFFLHRISSLEMVTFVVKLTGEVEHGAPFKQRGKAAM